MTSLLTPQGFVVPMQAAPEVEAQTLMSFLQVQTGDLIRKLYSTLEQHGTQYPQLNDCVPILGQAVELYKAGDFAQAFTATYYAYRQWKLVAAQVPDLPEPIAPGST
jgi:hypothetical protein